MGHRIAVWGIALALLPVLVVPSAQPGAPDLVPAALVDIADLSPREYREAGFVLGSAQSVRMEAVAAEPRFERRNGWDDCCVDDTERDTWPAAAWITDARTRAVVWDVRTANTDRDGSGVRRFSGTVRLPAGVYVAQYASYVATSYATDTEGRLASVLRGVLRNGRRYAGPYVDDGSYERFRLTIEGEGHPATARDLDAAAAVFMTTAFATLRPHRSDAARTGFVLERPAEVEVVAVGELFRRGAAVDYAWLLNADTHARVWTMDWAGTDPAGGAAKNRIARRTLHLPAGRYVAYFVADDSHDPDEWNAVPPADPALWGLTLRLADAGARARLRTFDYSPVPDGQTIVSLAGLGDNERRSAGFALRRAMDVHIFALGECSGGTPDDYGYIVQATTRRRVWSFDCDQAEAAGGADKNRQFDGTVRLEAGSYMVHWRTDGSHSYRNWNDAPPAEGRFWGISVFPASGRLDRSVIGPYQREARGPVIAELIEMGDLARRAVRFRLDREQTIHVRAEGEGMGGDMYDWAWIEDADGRAVWEMTYRMTESAGGAQKNRLYEGTIRLPAGTYYLHYRSDGSHSYDDWNAAPPDDPEGWGVTLTRVGAR